MRLATMVTSRGLRLHVKAADGYVDVADATGNPAFAALGSVLATGTDALDAIRAVANGSGSEFAPARFEPADFGPAVPEPPRILCLGVNYSEHAIEEIGRASM